MAVVMAEQSESSKVDWMASKMVVCWAELMAGAKVCRQAELTVENWVPLLVARTAVARVGSSVAWKVDQMVDLKALELVVSKADRTGCSWVAWWAVYSADQSVDVMAVRKAAMLAGD
jgi:hypothetical protein